MAGVTSTSDIKHGVSGVMRVSGPLLLIGLALFAGPFFNFVPDVIRQERFAPDLMWHDRQRIEQIILLGIVAIAAATIWRKHLIISLKHIPKLASYALGLGFMLGGLSAAFSALPRFAWLEWTTFLLLLGLALFIAGQARLGGTRFDRWAIWVVVIFVASGIAIKIMLEYLFSLVLGGKIDTVDLFSSMFSNRRVFGQVASMIIPLLTYPLLMGCRSRIRRWGLFALLAIWWMLVIVSGSRGAWIALGVASGVLAVVGWHACVGWLKVQTAALSIGLLLFLLLFVYMPAWLGKDSAFENRLSNITSLSGRGELWATAWEQIHANPWLGIGPMHLATFPSPFGAHPHNAILQLAAEWGVPAALALILPALLGILQLLKTLRERTVPSLLLICLTASLLAACVLSMVDGVLVIPYTQIWLVLVVGWALGVYSRNVAASALPVRESFMARLGMPVLSLFALITLLIGIFPDVMHRVEVTKAFIDDGNLHLPPRYWLVGRLH